MRTLRNTLAIAIGACSATAPAWAASETGAKAMFEEVVVTARRAPRIVMEASETVSVIDREQLRRNTAYELADAMRGLPGLQVTDGGQPGLKRVRIRGEESRRTAILLDGQEITDHWEYGTPLSLNPLLVERIEVVRGSGSVLYGPRALSGVVNFITRKGGTEPLQFEASSGWNSATNGRERFASVFGDLHGLGYRVAVSDGDHGKRDTPDGEIENTAFDNNSVYAWIGRDFGAHRLELLYDRYESATDVFVEEEQRTAFPLTDFRVDVPQRDREKIGLSYQWRDVAGFLPLIKVQANRARNDRQFNTFSSTFLPVPRPVATDRSVYSDAELEMDDVVTQFDWIPARDHYIVSGIQYSEERVTQDRHVDIVTNGVTGRPEDIRDQAAIKTLALFVQDEWHGRRAHHADDWRTPVPRRGPARGEQSRRALAGQQQRYPHDRESRSEPRAQRRSGPARQRLAGLRLPLAAAVCDRRLRGVALREPESGSEAGNRPVVGSRGARTHARLGVRRRRVPQRIRGLHRPRVLHTRRRLHHEPRQALREHR
jgi:hemoglobin/transferrin/lactoferrin receptor protein